MKQLLLKSVGGALVAFSVLAALPMSAQAAESALECKSGASHAVRVEWGLPTADCAAVAQPEAKTPGGVMGPARSSEGGRFAEPAGADQTASYGAQPTPY